MVKPVNMENLFSNSAIIVTNKSFLVPVALEDAEFIFNLRKSHEKSFLREGAGSVQGQEDYLSRYISNLPRREEIYYKILNQNGLQPEAVVRLTELQSGVKFNWESLISVPNGDPSIPIDVMMAIYSVGFDFLCKEVCGPWDVDKNHSSMQKIHDRIGMAKICDETEDYYRYQVLKSDFRQKCQKFQKLGFGIITGIKDD